MKKIFLLLLAFTCMTVTLQAVEAYAVLSTDKSTLTFYNDNNKASRSGTKFALNEKYNKPGWYDKDNSAVTKVTFDSSFSSARPTSTYCWFMYMRKLTSIEGIRNLNTSEVTNMRCMFSYCNSLKSVDLSGFNTTKVKDLDGFFSDCVSLEYSDFSSFNTSNVLYFSAMFNGCSSIRELDLSSFYTTKGTSDMRSMFNSCKSLEKLNICNFVFTNITNASLFFYGCNKLKSLTIPSTINYLDNNICSSIGKKEAPCRIYAPNNFNFGVDTSGDYFQWKGGYFTLRDISYTNEPYALLSSDGTTLTFYYDNNKSSRIGTTYSLNTGSNLPGWFNYDNKTEKVIFDASFSQARPTTTYYWFGLMKNLTSIEGMQYLNTSMVTNMCSMFGGCEKLAYINLNNFDTSKVIDMQWMFEACHSLDNLDVRKIDTSNVTDMGYMFAHCTNLTSLDLSTFDTSNVTSMMALFFGCTNMTNIDLSSFNTSKVTHMGGMFHNCSSLSNIDVSSFNTSNVTTMRDIFSGCTSLKRLDVSNFDMSKTNIRTSEFQGCISLQDFYISSSMWRLTDNACSGIGSATNPCSIYAPDGFDFRVETSGNYFQWKGGYFRYAQGAVSITMSDVDVPQGGSGEMVVTFNNNHPDLLGLQIEFTLPDGIHLVGGELGKVVKEHNPKMSLQLNDRRDDGVTVILCFQVDITSMPTGEYELMRLTFEAEDDVPLGKYSITTTHLEFADRLTGQELHLPAQTFNINVVDGIIPTPLVGDVNNDGLLSLADAVCIISWLLEQEPPVFKEELADFNEDGNITNSDAVAIILYLLDGGAANAPMARAKSEVSNKVVGYETSLEGFDLQMGVLHDYTAMMMDVTLPEGETLQEVTLDGGHSLAFRALGEGRYRIAAWSMGMEPLRDGAVLHCTTSSGHAGRVVVDNLRLVDMDTYEFGAKALSCEPTGISEVTAGEAGEVYHTLGGVRVTRPGHGVYVTKGRKVVK